MKNEVTYTILRDNWDLWSIDNKMNFAQFFAFRVIPNSTEYKDILRFLIQHGDFDIWSIIAMRVASQLPSDESVPIICKWCEQCPVGSCANFYQAIAFTNSKEAINTLKKAYNSIRRYDDILFNDSHLEITYDLVLCIMYLLELKENPSYYKEIYQKLMLLPSKSSHDIVQENLGKYYMDNNALSIGASCEVIPIKLIKSKEKIK